MIRSAYFFIILCACWLSACSSTPWGFVNAKADAGTEEITPQAPSGEQDQTFPELVALCHPTEQELSEFALWREFDLWDRVRSEYELIFQPNKRIDTHLQWFKRHPEYIPRVVNRGTPYLFHIVDELDKRNMPAELVFLPIVESAFDPFAYSPGRASGMWQIIPSTGKMLGLEQTWWYDGRRDIVASTDAALNYLQRLNKRFDGDWYLTLAAYNSGAGTVNKAIRRAKKRGKATDYWSLDLPRETRHYVPKLLALATLFNQPEAHGIQLASVPNNVYFGTVNLDQQIDLAQAAKLAQISIDDLYKLNPGFNRWATDPDVSQHLVLPIAKVGTFAKALAATPPNQLVTWRRHNIQRGETLSHVAKHYKVSVSSLKTFNSLTRDTIRAGDTLLVPTASAGRSHYRLSSEERLKRIQSKAPGGKQRIDYTVRSGDSFWEIARKHNVNMAKLAKWNGMSPRDPLKIGQTLVIWVSGDVTALRANGDKIIRKLSYRVRSGDSLHKIANKFKVRVADIVSWNQINQSKYLQPGQSLVLYVDVRNT